MPGPARPDFTVTVLGCAGSYPGPGTPSTGYLVRHGATSVWLDAGSGTFAELQRHIGLDELSAVVLTHAHVDHWADLVQLRTVVRYFRPELAGIPVYGTAETLALLEPLCGGDVATAFSWTTTTAELTFTTGSLAWSLTPTDHSVETFAVRADAPDGRSFAYSADTGPGWDPAAIGAVDLLLCEASTTVGEEGIAPHLSGRQAGLAARTAAAGRLVVTHVIPGHDGEEHRRDAEAAFGEPVELATVGVTFEI